MSLAALPRRIVRRRVRAYEQLDRLGPRFDAIVDRRGPLPPDLAEDLIAAVAAARRATSRQKGWRPRVGRGTVTAGEGVVALLRSQYVLGKGFR